MRECVCVHILCHMRYPVSKGLETKNNSYRESRGVPIGKRNCIGRAKFSDAASRTPYGDYNCFAHDFPNFRFSRHQQILATSFFHCV